MGVESVVSLPDPSRTVVLRSLIFDHQISSSPRFTGNICEMMLFVVAHSVG